MDLLLLLDPELLLDDYLELLALVGLALVVAGGLLGIDPEHHNLKLAYEHLDLEKQARYLDLYMNCLGKMMVLRSFGT